MRLLVTGHCGFIGGHVVDALRGNLGHHVMCADREDPSGRVDLDKPSGNAWQAIVRSNPEAVVHLAAHADVRRNWTDASMRAIWRDNMIATINLLEAAAAAGSVRAIVFISTGAVYAGSTGPVLEASPVTATSPYAASKLAGEAYVQAYAAKNGWRWYVLRPAACFGTGYHHGHVADFVRQMREAKRIETLDDGMTPRPALHARDLAEACVALATGDVPSGVFNAAGGVWSWRDTIRVMAEMSGRPVPYRAADKKNGWLGDSRGALWSSHLLEHVGVPMRRKIEDGVRDALTSLGWPS